MKNNHKIKPSVFYPPFILLFGCILFNFVDQSDFEKYIFSIYSYIIDQFGWMFILLPSILLLACVWIYLSPMGNIRIGGKNAQPQIRKKTWFTITLCTTIAAGIVFWAAAEPIQHILYPKASLGISPLSSDAIEFAMTTIYTHWTFLPYAIYTIATVMFAFGFYNMKKPFSLGATISPLLNEKRSRWINPLIDCICVFSLIAGLSSSLGVGVLNINGGLTKLFGVQSSPVIWALIIAILVVTFIISAITGIMKGIKILSDINTYIYIVIIAFILIFGGTAFICSLGVNSFGNYLTNFFSQSLSTGIFDTDDWTKQWTIFYFGNWLAWAPITAVFLGRLSYGRTVKEIIIMNLVCTSIFSVIWFSIISGATINYAINVPNSGILEAFRNGYENTIYQLFQNLPLSVLTVPLYFFAVFISFVTAADSTTVAISGICSTGISPDSPESPKYIKIIWGLTIAVVTWIMMSVGEGITGLKIMANIGGFFSMFFMIAVLYCAILISIKPQKYNLIEQECKNEK